MISRICCCTESLRSAPNAAAMCSASSELPVERVSLSSCSSSPEARLDLAAHVVDVGRRALVVDHPGADLDRLRDRLRGRAPSAGLLAHHARRAGVRDGQPLDHQPVVERADRGVGGGLVERELWLLGRFHGTYEGSREPGREPDAVRARRSHTLAPSRWTRSQAPLTPATLGEEIICAEQPSVRSLHTDERAAGADRARAARRLRAPGRPRARRLRVRLGADPARRSASTRARERSGARSARPGSP